MPGRTLAEAGEAAWSQAATLQEEATAVEHGDGRSFCYRRTREGRGDRALHRSTWQSEKILEINQNDGKDKAMGRGKHKEPWACKGRKEGSAQEGA